MATALVTGASRGIGLALSRELDSRGHRVLCGMRQPEPLPGTLLPFELNVRDEHGVDRAIGALAQEHRIDILINNAGIHVGGPLCEVEQDDFKRVLDVNLLGAWRVTRAALRHMLPGGTIAMVSSLSGLVGMAGDGPYAASKFALEGMSQSLAAELAPRGIRVAALELGAVATGFAGADKGDAPADIAREMADILENPGSGLRYPVGDQAREIMRRLGTDDGTCADELVESLTGAGMIVRT